MYKSPRRAEVVKLDTFSSREPRRRKELDDGWFAGGFGVPARVEIANLVKFMAQSARRRSESAIEMYFMSH